MPYCPLRLSIECAYPNLASKALSCPTLGILEDIYHQPTILHWNYRESNTRRISHSLVSFSPARSHHLQTSAKVGELYSLCETYQPKVKLSSFEVQSINEDAETDSSPVLDISLVDGNSKEEERRRKIGLANKGRVPWNKGRKHSEETRMRIKERTLEVLRDPKVRKKMSEHPQLHSDETKAKISSSLRRLWHKRLKWKQLREKFILAWSESIAKAAKKGGSGQRELDWDSYDGIKKEIALEQLQWAAEKAKAKEQAKLRSEKAALAKAEKMERLAQRRKEHEERALAGREMKKLGKSGHGKENMAMASELKLKRRLTKIHRKKSKHGRVAIGMDRVISVTKWEKLDLELIKKERMRREISLADQIQDAKNRRAGEVPSSSSSSSSSLVSQFSMRCQETGEPYSINTRF